MNKKWICTVCGYIHEGPEPPEKCPICKQPKEKFSELQDNGGLTYATVHNPGEAKNAPQEFIDFCRAEFNGECCEVGMYLAMARQADREGYPEIAAAFRKYGLEEAEHAAHYAELLGEVLGKTKDNVKKRMFAEQQACANKFEMAKAAKAQNLDALHDFIHEAAKDEARHSSGFKGLYDRYFGDK